MSNLNWPDGATHYLQAGEENTRFRDLSGENWKYFNSNTGVWSQHYFSSEELLTRTDLIERPKQPQAWSGAEDGLPPIGMTVQVWDREPHKFYENHVGKSVEILAHRIGGYGYPVAVYCFKEDDGTDGYHALVDECFRLVQPAEDARESAIREVMDIAQVDCRVTAARLVDAGFKRELK